MLKVGQEVLVQIAKEPISTKGPRLTSELSFAGRYIVLIPFADKVSVSTKIKSAVWTITRSEDFARPFVKLLGNRQALGEVFHITRDREGYLWRRPGEGRPRRRAQGPSDR